MTRRTFVRAAALGVGGLVLAACSAPRSSLAPTPDPNPSPPSPEPSPTPARPLRERIASLLIVGFRGLEAGDAGWIQSAIADQGLGGVILFDRDGKTQGPRNVESPDQVARLTADLRALARGRELIVAIDQEGGRVTRLKPEYGFPRVRSQAAVGSEGDAAVQAWADGLAGTLADAGINLNLAPVVDLDINPSNPAIGALNRAFSADPTVVARDAAIEVMEHRARGIRTALKHFPGLGSATANTDFGVADVTATWTDTELDPYRRLIEQDLVDMVMAAHVVNGQIDASAPASLSWATITGLLRGQLGWSGVVVTDDLQAGAIADPFGFEGAVALALEAGNDLLLFANQQTYDEAIVSNVIDLVERLIGEGRLAEARIDESVARIERLFPSTM
jgi:beta-N-acetylhexosaminidase